MYFNENEKAHITYTHTALFSPYSVPLTSWHKVWPGWKTHRKSTQNTESTLGKNSK